jgi:TonB family protein
MPRVPYPEGAEGDVAVVLELSIGPDGKVREAKVVDGREPFAAAALKAAPQWTFTPAKRGDVAIGARIRVRVEFTAPKKTPDANADANANAADAGASADAGANTNAGANTDANGGGAASMMEQVEVLGVRKEVGQTTMGGGEVRQLPGAFGDAFRAMEALPGVTPIISGLPFFYVRGAPPGNVGYYLDGVRIPLLFHLGLGPSVVHPGMVDHVDFYPGGFPARFGRFAGGILSGETRPPAYELHGEGNIRLIDSGLLLEGPIGKDTSVLVAGRYSYTALLLTIAAAISGNKVRLDYWDYQGRIAHRLNSRDTISVFAFGSYDYLGAEIDQKFQDLFQTEFHRIDLRWDRRLDDGRMRLAVTLGYDRTGGGGDAFGVQDWISGARFELEKQLNSSVRFRMGSDAWLDHSGVYSNPNNDRNQPSPPPDPNAPAPGSPSPSPSGSSAGSPSDSTSSSGSTSSLGVIPARNDLAMGLWVDVVWKVTPRVEIIPGARFDLFGSSNEPVNGQISTSGSDAGSTFLPGGGAAQPAFDPRLATRIHLVPRVTSVEQVAVSHQPPSFLVPVPGLQIGRLKSGLQTAYTLSQGFEFALPYETTLTTTGFSQSYEGLTDFLTSCASRSSDQNADCLDERVRGRTIGLEVLLRRSLMKRYTGWVSYTLSETLRQTNAPVAIINPANVPPSLSTGGAIIPKPGLTNWIPGEFDRRHVLNVIGAADLGKGFRAGARLVFYTGTPYSPKINDVDVPPYNSLRLPDFWRLDLRLEKKFIVKNGYISAVLEGMNVTAQKEAVGVSCDSSKKVNLIYDTCTPTIIGPITIPSIGVEGAL